MVFNQPLNNLPKSTEERMTEARLLEEEVSDTTTVMSEEMDG